MRKIKRDNGAAAKAEIGFFRRSLKELEGLGASRLGDMATNLSNAVEALDQATTWLLDPGRSPDEVLAVASPYLRLFGLTAAGAYLANGTSAALREAGAPKDFVPASRFYAEHMLIAAPAVARTVIRGAGAVLEEQRA
ncbi:MAG: acyl-CoA dehydrogenase C-terminal domain-containing protein [Acetobacteraceae bacterium]|nr:acyl-CoA dehydrogenase C-terminal domain-containing protein [Acetobacteraceae bacterium]